MLPRINGSSTQSRRLSIALVVVSVVRAVRGIVVASGLGLACSPAPTDADTAPLIGILTISVTGLASTGPSGGAALLTRNDIKGQATFTVGIPNQGRGRSSVAVHVPMGTYTIFYLPPEGYALPAGAGQQKTVVVKSADASASVSFDVAFSGVATPEWGFLGIEANFLGAPYPATGGSASILRIDIAGPGPFDLAIPNEASEGYFAVAQVFVGTYAVTYTPPSGYRLPAGDPNVQTVIVGDAHATAWVKFNVMHIP